jgi:hypothetical protein
MAIIRTGAAVTVSLAVVGVGVVGAILCLKYVITQNALVHIPHYSIVTVVVVLHNKNIRENYTTLSVKLSSRSGLYD